MKRRSRRKCFTEREMKICPCVQGNAFQHKFHQLSKQRFCTNTVRLAVSQRQGKRLSTTSTMTLHNKLNQMSSALFTEKKTHKQVNQLKKRKRNACSRFYKWLPICPYVLYSLRGVDLRLWCKHST